MGDVAAAVLMDRLYRRQRHFYDLTRKHYLLGRDRLIEGLAPPSGGRVLEIGCGTARNLVAAARAWPEVQFFGIDISAEMLDTARRVVGRAGLAARIELARGDATSFDPAWLFGVPCFSRIFFSYSLSMIPDWRSAWPGRWSGCRRAANCISSTSAARSACRGGSAPACGAGWRASTSVRATSWRPNSPRSRVAPARSACWSGRMAATPSTRYFTGA